MIVESLVDVCKAVESRGPRHVIHVKPERASEGGKKPPRGQQKRERKRKREPNALHSIFTLY